MFTRSPGVRLAGALLASLATAPMSATAAVADDYPAGETISPGTLSPGPTTPLLHVVGRTIVDGEIRSRVASGEHVSLVGRRGKHYLVMVSDRDHEDWRLLRETRQSTLAKYLAGGPASQPEFRLATGGEHVVLATRTRDDRTILRVLDTGTGHLVARRAFGPTLTPLDFGGRRMVLSQWADRRHPARTFWWNPFNGRTRKIADGTGYLADVSADRIGVMLGDPYQGGCQKVMTLTRPRTTLWRSCKDRALAFSPQGRRMVSGHLLEDGPGPSVVQVRGAHGRVLDTYRSRWFGFAEWETDTRLLLQVAGPRSVAVARCTLAGCQRVSRLYRTKGREPWTVMPRWTFPAQ